MLCQTVSMSYCISCNALSLVLLSLFCLVYSTEVVQLPISTTYFAECWALPGLVEYSGVFTFSDLAFWYAFCVLLFVFFICIFYFSLYMTSNSFLSLMYSSITICDPWDSSPFAHNDFFTFHLGSWHDYEYPNFILSCTFVLSLHLNSMLVINNQYFNILYITPPE